MRRIQYASCLVSVLAIVASVTAACAMECGYKKLPASARDILKRDFPGWQMATVGELSVDDQRLWVKNYHGACPGIVAGNFAIAGSFAVTLIRRDAGSLWQILILFEPSHSGYTYRMLSDATRATVPSVLLKFPPRRYSDAEHTQTIQIKSDSVAYVQLEAAGMLFYRSSGGFKSLQISE